MENNEIVHELGEFAQRANSYNGQMVARIKADLEFAGGKQYDDQDTKIRGENRAQLNFNLIRNYANQIINEYRAKPFGITISARKPDAVQKAEIAQGIIRGIESMCDAQSKYTLAIDRQVKGGLGYCVITSDYNGESGFEQDIIINGIHRPDLVIYDPYSKEVDGADANEAAFVEHISCETAEQILGEEKDWEYISSPLAGTAWNAPDDSVALVTYFRLNRKKETIYQGANGEILTDVKNPKGMKSRTVVKKSVSVYKIVGDEVVSETELPLSRLPIVPFRGELVDKDGKLDWVGLSYFGRDPQKLVNYAASLTAERISIGPKATNFVDMRSIANYKDIWAKSNRLNLPYLPYDSKDAEGNQYNSPTPRDVSVQIGDVTAAQSNYQGMLASILGMQEQGQRVDGASNETAAAVMTRAKSTEISNYQYLDNAAKSVKAIGRIVLELMNIIYDTERMIPIDVNGESQLNNINVAELDIIPDELTVNVDAGPMLATQRKEELSMLLAMSSILGPEATMVISDDIIRSSDLPEAENIATKLASFAKMKLGIGADTSGQPDPEATTALDQASATIDQLQQQIQQYQVYMQQVQTEKQVAEIEAKSRIIVKQMDNDTKIYIEQMKINNGNEQMLAQLKADYEKSQQDAQLELMKLYKSQPQINVVADTSPSFTPIDGLRNKI